MTKLEIGQPSDRGKLAGPYRHEPYSFSTASPVHNEIAARYSLQPDRTSRWKTLFEIDVLLRIGRGLPKDTYHRGTSELGTR